MYATIPNSGMSVPNPLAESAAMYLLSFCGSSRYRGRDAIKDSMVSYELDFDAIIETVLISIPLAVLFAHVKYARGRSSFDVHSPTISFKFIALGFLLESQSIFVSARF